MKFYLFLIVFGQTFQVLAQDPDPRLFSTWYLTFVQATDKDTPYLVSEIIPSIQPYLEVFEDFSFIGEGACNSFNGSASFPYPGYFEMEIVEFIFDTEDCGIQIHNSFENSYFGFLQGAGKCEITEDQDGLLLTITNPLMGTAVFQDYPLSLNSFSQNNIHIYPNPFNSIVTIDSKNLPISQVVLYSVSGKKVYQEFNPNVQINFSDLKAVIYFLKLESEGIYYVKKILKY